MRTARSSPSTSPPAGCSRRIPGTTPAGISNLRSIPPSAPGISGAPSRNLKYLRFVHRLDAETTGITLFAKSPGALHAYSELFEERRVEKFYLAVVHGIPKQTNWTCDLPLRPDPSHKGRMLTTPARESSPLPPEEPRGRGQGRGGDPLPDNRGDWAATSEKPDLEKDAQNSFSQRPPKIRQKTRFI